MLFAQCRGGRPAPASGGTSETGAQFGRLEIFSRGGWGTICGEQRRDSVFFRGAAEFNEAAADIACQQLGFQEGALTVTPVRLYKLVESTSCARADVMFTRFHCRIRACTLVCDAQ